MDVACGSNSIPVYAVMLYLLQMVPPCLVCYITTVVVMCLLDVAVQGFASVSQSISTGSTLWGAHHMPQNRDAVMLAAGDGSLSLWKYQYPDQRKVKVGAG